MVQHIHHSLLGRGPVALCILLVPFGLNGWMQLLAALTILLNESSICLLIQIQTLHPPTSPFKLQSFKQTMKAERRHISAALLAVVLKSCTWMMCVCPGKHLSFSPSHVLCGVWSSLNGWIWCHPSQWFFALKEGFNSNISVVMVFYHQHLLLKVNFLSCGHKAVTLQLIT